MLTKLTLTIDESVVAQAKVFAKHKQRSISRLVEEYLRDVSATLAATPLTDSLTGMFQDDGKDYREMLGEARDERLK
jgi:hypothetical protein